MTGSKPHTSHESGDASAKEMLRAEWYIADGNSCMGELYDSHAAAARDCVRRFFAERGSSEWPDAHLDRIAARLETLQAGDPGYQAKYGQNATAISACASPGSLGAQARADARERQSPGRPQKNAGNVARDKENRPRDWLAKKAGPDPCRGSGAAGENAGSTLENWRQRCR